jgi:cytochrome c-type biogenesis protein CcmH
VTLLLLVVAPVARADALDDETRRIAKQLQCPVCESVSVADSPSDLAGQMRSVIRSKLEQGESEQQIVAYFVERYGAAVLTEPPRRGFAAGVWIGPVVVLALGALALALVLRAWLHARLTPSSPALISSPSQNGSSKAAPADAPPKSYVDRARQELEGFRTET